MMLNLKMEVRRRLKQCFSQCIKQPHTITNTIEEFLNMGGNVNKVHKKTTLLCEACRCGESNSMECLIQAGADVNLPDVDGCTPVYLAASHGHAHVVSKLIQAGSNLNVINKTGYTPLVSALKNDNNSCAKLLIEAGACVNVEHPHTLAANISLLTFVLFAKGDWVMADILVRAGMRPYKFPEPLGFVLLDDLEVPLELMRTFIYAGFNMFVESWVLRAESRTDGQMPDTKKELLELIKQERYFPPVLQRLCRTVIRIELSKTSHIPQHLSRKIQDLPLPTEVQKYINLEYL